jgi:hypothetical protein
MSPNTGDNCMTKKAIISIDLAALAGTMRFVPGTPLPRHDKRLLERSLAGFFLAHLSQREGCAFSDVFSSPSDPPDVTFIYAGQRRAMELSELVPENRFEKDAILRNLRRDVLAGLRLGEHTSGFVVTIFLTNDYSARIRPGRIHASLAEALNGFFARNDPVTQSVAVPESVRDIVTRISIFREDLAGDPRLGDPREPLIVFGAQHTILIPEDDCPTIVASRLSRKGRHDLSEPTWLVLWTTHHALDACRNQLDNAIAFYLQRHPVKYERIFHLHLFPGSGATEFPVSAMT